MNVELLTEVGLELNKTQNFKDLAVYFDNNQNMLVTLRRVVTVGSAYDNDQAEFVETKKWVQALILLRLATLSLMKSNDGSFLEVDNFNLSIVPQILTEMKNTVCRDALQVVLEDLASNFDEIHEIADRLKFMAAVMAVNAARAPQSGQLAADAAAQR